MGKLNDSTKFLKKWLKMVKNEMFKKVVKMVFFGDFEEIQIIDETYFWSEFRKWQILEKMSDFWSKMREKRVEQLEKHQFGIPTQVKTLKKGLKTGVLKGSKMGDSGISRQI